MVLASSIYIYIYIYRVYVDSHSLGQLALASKRTAELVYINAYNIFCMIEVPTVASPLGFLGGLCCYIVNDFFILLCCTSILCNRIKLFVIAIILYII